MKRREAAVVGAVFGILSTASIHPDRESGLDGEHYDGT
jgi:hypothetical protein